MKKLTFLLAGIGLLVGVSLAFIAADAHVYAKHKTEMAPDYSVMLNDAVIPSVLPNYGHCMYVNSPDVDVINVSAKVNPVANSPPQNSKKET